MTGRAVMIAVSPEPPARAPAPRTGRPPWSAPGSRGRRAPSAAPPLQRAFDMQRRPAFDDRLHEEGDQDDTPAQQNRQSRHSGWRKTGAWLVVLIGGRDPHSDGQGAQRQGDGREDHNGSEPHLAGGAGCDRTAGIGDGEHAMIGVHQRQRDVRASISATGHSTRCRPSRTQPDQHHAPEKGDRVAVARQHHAAAKRQCCHRQRQRRQAVGRTPAQAIASAQAQGVNPASADPRSRRRHRSAP
jgi:hypothetical protein